MLDTPRLSFDFLIKQSFPKAPSHEAEPIKKVLQDICDYALNTYLLRNSQYMYIQCMGTQMRFFVEYVIDEDIDSQIKKGDKQTGTLEYVKKRKYRLAEKAFLKFAWFHEAILPVSFYANTAQV
jgi:hypothetical protein